MERMLEEASKEFAEVPWFGRDGGRAAAVDVAERDGEFVVTCDLPGFDRDDIDLRVTDHTLHIEAAHEEETEEEEENYLHRERHRRDVSRTIPLPEDVDMDAGSASYEDGVLTVTLPKVAEGAEEAHRIPLS